MSKHATAEALTRHAGTSDPDEFQLPVPGLFADVELGRGSIQLADDFQQHPGLVKLQIIRDWQHALLRHRRDALNQFADELSRGCPGMSPVERQTMLRSVCSSLRIELPANFAAVPAEP